MVCIKSVNLSIVLDAALMSSAVANLMQLTDHCSESQHKPPTNAHQNHAWPYCGWIKNWSQRAKTTIVNISKWNRYIGSQLDLWFNLTYQLERESNHNRPINERLFWYLMSEIGAKWADMGHRWWGKRDQETKWLSSQADSKRGKRKKQSSSWQRQDIQLATKCTLFVIIRFF